MKRPAREDAGARARPLGRVPRPGPDAAVRRYEQPADGSAPTTTSTGAAGGTSAPAPSATWPATPPTWRSWPCKLGHPTHVSRRGRRRQPGDLPELRPRHARVPGPRRHAAGHAALVRRPEGRQEADPAGGAGRRRRSPSTPTPRRKTELVEQRRRSWSARRASSTRPDDYGAEVFFGTGEVDRRATDEAGEAADQQRGRPGPEEGVGRGDQGRQAGAGAVELRLRQPC